MSKPRLIAVSVSETNHGSEFYEVGKNNVSSIEWGSTDGHMAALATVRVFKDGALSSEHPFSNVLGVYYDLKEAEGESDA